MDRRVRLDDPWLSREPKPSTTAAVIYVVVFLWCLHQVSLYFDCPILSPQELFWNALVYVTPSRLLLSAEKRQALKAKDMISQAHAAKSEAMRRAFGLGNNVLMQRLPVLKELSSTDALRRSSLLAPREVKSDAPPGLGNWDNSCYQNSVLQGFASLQSLRTYLTGPPASRGEDAGASEDPDSETTRTSLSDLIGRLNDRTNNGRRLWTPAKLKNMSSWQQQDAQEYFSKIMDELDKEAVRAVKKLCPASGIEAIVDPIKEGTTKQKPSESAIVAVHNPVEGLLAQKVVCTRCGFWDGVSMIPFNCLTLPLGADFVYTLEQCLQEYTKLEEITEVECAKCTLVDTAAQLKRILAPATVEVTDHASPDAPLTGLNLPPELRAMTAKRLQTIEQALEDDDFSDKTLNDVCQIPKRAHTNTTKIRQAVIGRAPAALVVHVNRSVFDELTGIQSKNYARVRYPMVLDLAPFTLADGFVQDATSSMLNRCGEQSGDLLYRLKAVVTHYGRHENGHYICYRQHPIYSISESNEESAEEKDREQLRWWRLSDEDVSPVTEDDVLAQSGVFMLFYEREIEASLATRTAIKTQAMSTEPNTSTAKVELKEVDIAALVPLPNSSHHDLDEAETPAAGLKDNVNGDAKPLQPISLEAALLGDDRRKSTTIATREDESEQPDQEGAAITVEAFRRITAPGSPLLMRTARGRQSSRSEGGFEQAYRPMAAT